jgi:hypothetical protein
LLALKSAINLVNLSLLHARSLPSIANPVSWVSSLVFVEFNLWRFGELNVAELCRFAIKGGKVLL